MKILHQKAGPEETVGLTKEDREHQVGGHWHHARLQNNSITRSQVPIIRSNVITALEVNVTRELHDLNKCLDPA